MAKYTRKTPKELAKDVSSKKKRKKRVIPPKFASTGSTLLNLAVSGRADGGWGCGGMSNVIGDSGWGKTSIALLTLACAAHNPEYDDYLLIHDDTENRMNFDLGYMYGQKTADRIQAPFEDEDGEPHGSETVEQFESNIIKMLKGGQKFIYVIDSWDGLRSEKEDKTWEENEVLRDAGKQASGTYGMTKQKETKAMFGRIMRLMKKSESFLIVLSQAMANIGSNGKRRSGGAALTFWSNGECWLAPLFKHDKITKTRNKEKIQIGTRTKITIKKNSLNGKKRDVILEILDDYGVDDISTSLDYLVKREEFTKTGQKIKGVIGDFAFDASKEIVVRDIEDLNMEEELSQLVGEVWQDFEDAITPDRKPRFE